MTQLFVVAGLGMDKTTATISMHQRDDAGNWKQILSTPGFVGLNGLCPDADHREGCAQTPIGVYHFNKAFGIAADPGCAIPYIQVDDSTYWSGDPDRQYNQMVDIRDVPELVMDDSEHIVDYEYQYQYCLNISFNEEGTPGRGSAIFLHCFGPLKPYTGGCVALPEDLPAMLRPAQALHRRLRRDSREPDEAGDADGPGRLRCGHRHAGEPGRQFLRGFFNQNREYFLQINRHRRRAWQFGHRLPAVCCFK